VNKKVERNYLEISYLEDLKDSSNLSNHYSINFVDPVDFQLNKFFYKNIGKSHHWVDRLVWGEKQWQDYVSDKKVKTYVLKEKNELAGYFELILHKDKNEVEIAYLGLLEEYQNKNPLREWCDNQSKKFDDKKFSDLFYEQLESTSKKLSNFSKKIGKPIEDLEIDDLVLLVEQR